MNITHNTKICAVIGDPITHSVSPQRHNAAYKALGLDKKYVFVAMKISETHLKDLIVVAKDIELKMMAVTMPHKVAIIKYLDEIDEDAKKIGAVNTVINNKGLLKGYNTDWFGIAEPLKKFTSLSGKRVGILGAGATTRSALFACIKNNALVKIYNRTTEHAKNLSLEFDCEYAGLDRLSELKTMDVIINTTSVGFESFQSIVDKNIFTSDQIVFDVIPSLEPTKFLQDAKEKGAKIINGREMGLYQAAMQFELYTGKKAPIEAMRNI